METNPDRDCEQSLPSTTPALTASEPTVSFQNTPSENPHHHNNNNKKKWQPKRRKTILAVLIATLGSFGLGMTLVWSAVALKELQDTQYFGELSSEQQSTIGSIIFLGAVIGAPISGLLMSSIGRKWTLCLTALPSVIGWILIAFSPTVWVMCLGRFLTGVSGGALTVCVPTYVTEVSERRIKSTLGTLIILMLVSGIEITFVIGAFVSWFWLSIACGVIPVIFFLLMAFMPESPRYLVIKRQGTAARRALQWLRRASTKKHIEPEIKEIENSVNSANQQSKVSSSLTLGDLLKLSVLKPLGISTSLMLISQISGVNGLSLYTTTVFEKTGASIDPNFAVIIIFGGQMITVLVVTLFLVENFGRKTLLMTSLSIMAIGLLAFGISFHSQTNNAKSENLSISQELSELIPEEISTSDSLNWLPLVSLCVIIIGYNIAMGPLPWLITSEIMPTHVQEMGSSIVTLFYWMFSFLAGFSFLPLKEALGESQFYWMCSGICVISVVYIFFCLPETKDKTPIEIKMLFASNEERELDHSKVSRIVHTTNSQTSVTFSEGTINHSFVLNETS